MTDTAKRAALALHALSLEDREWALGRLEHNERALLRDYLAELEDLGFPSDALEFALEEHAEEPAAGVDPVVEIIDSAAPHLVHRIMRDEQLSTLALVMDYYPWRWRDRVLRLLGRPKSNAIRQMIEQDGRTAADVVCRTVIEALADVIRGAPESNSRSNRFSTLGWQR